MAPRYRVAGERRFEKANWSRLEGSKHHSETAQSVGTTSELSQCCDVSVRSQQRQERLCSPSRPDRLRGSTQSLLQLSSTDVSPWETDRSMKTAA